ncbi:MAG: porin family protein [Gammaproteobacteria bacterium]|nr:porin family protein [Gammaproteobacteria bacterium]
MHKLPRSILLIVVLLTGFVSVASAEHDFYVGGTIGSARLDDRLDTFEFDSTSVAFRIFAGWQFSDHLSVEVGYLDFGDFEQDFDIVGNIVPATVSANGFTVGLNGALPLGGRFALTGRAGMFFWNGTASLGGILEASPDDVNPYFGAGARYQFTDRFAATADFTHYDLEETDSGVLAAGFDFRF